MLYNLNLPVKVRLSLRGILVLEKHHFAQIKKYNLPYKNFQIPETDKDGWSKFDSVAELCEIFGGYSWVCNEPFGMEVDFCNE